MDKTEKKQLFRQAACSAMAGLLAHDGEMSYEEQKDFKKENEVFFAERAVGYAEQLVKTVDEAEKVFDQTGRWRK